MRIINVHQKPGGELSLFPSPGSQPCTIKVNGLMMGVEYILPKLTKVLKDRPGQFIIKMKTGHVIHIIKELPKWKEDI